MTALGYSESSYQRQVYVGWKDEESMQSLGRRMQRGQSCCSKGPEPKELVTLKTVAETATSS